MNARKNILKRGEVQYYNGVIPESQYYNSSNMQGAWNSSIALL